MTVKPSLIGIEQGVARPGLWSKNGAGDSADQVPGYEATYLEDDLLDLKWRTATAGAADTRVIRTLDAPAAGRLGLLGRHNLSEAALVRLIADRDHVERPTVEFREPGDVAFDPQDLDPLPDWSFCCRVLLRPVETLNTPKMRFFAFAGTTFADANRQFELRIQTSPLDLAVQLVVNDFTATDTIAQGPPLTPGWYDLKGRFRSSDRRLELWVGQQLVATATAPAVTLPTRSDLRMLFGGGQTAHYELMDFQLWERWITDAELLGYRATAPAATARGLVAAYAFGEGQGNTTTSPNGRTLSLSGLDWYWRTNPFPDADSGVLEVWHDWVDRQALYLTGGDHLETAAVFAVPRSITVELSFRVDPTDPLPPVGQDAPLLWFGVNHATAELEIAITDTGHLRARSRRGVSLSQVTTPAAVNDGQIHHVEAVLDGLDALLELRLDGDSQGTDGVEPWATQSGAKVVLGASLTGQDATVTLFEVRLYAAARTPNPEPWRRLAPTDPDLLLHLDLDGDALDDAAATATTLTGGTWITVRNPDPDARWLDAARPGLRGADPLATYPRKRPILLPEEVEWRVALLQIWDRHNPDGHVELGRFEIYAAIQPDVHRVIGASRRRVKPALKRTTQGVPYRERGASHDVERFRLKYLSHDEATAIYDRLLRSAADERPVLVIPEPNVEPHQLAGRSIWGIARPRDVTEQTLRTHAIDLDVEAIE